MTAEEREELIERYNRGVATDHEVRMLETLLSKGELTPDQLQVWQQLMRDWTEPPLPSPALDDRFYAQLAKEKQTLRPFTALGINAWGWWPRLATVVALLALGLLVGYQLQPAKDPSVEKLTQEVSDIKELMMLSLLERESAAERLKAVNLTRDFTQASDAVTRALLKTLNEDANVNVRLAALEALYPYTQQEEVRTALVRSIALQESPLVQMALAELMVAIQEKRSINEFEKLLRTKRVPQEVEKKIEQSVKSMS